MSIAGDLIRGHTDTIILARLMLRDSYGYEINKTVTQLSGGKLELKRGHPVHRLPAAGGRRGLWPPTGAARPAAPGGGTTPLLPQGREACSRLLAEWEETKEIMDKLLEGGEILMRDKLKTYIDYLFAGAPQTAATAETKANSAKHPGQIRRPHCRGENTGGRLFPWPCPASVTWATFSPRVSDGSSPAPSPSPGPAQLALQSAAGLVHHALHLLRHSRHRREKRRCGDDVHHDCHSHRPHCFPGHLPAHRLPGNRQTARNPGMKRRMIPRPSSARASTP